MRRPGGLCVPRPDQVERGDDGDLRGGKGDKSNYQRPSIIGLISFFAPLNLHPCPLKNGSAARLPTGCRPRSARPDRPAGPPGPGDIPGDGGLSGIMTPVPFSIPSHFPFVYSPQQREFPGCNKGDTLTDYCKRCDYRFACHGECPKNRFSKSPDGQPGTTTSVPACGVSLPTPIRIFARLPLSVAQQGDAASRDECANGMLVQRVTFAVNWCESR